MTLAGLDSELFLTTGDEPLRSRMLAVARAASALRRSEADYLAVQIANNVMKGLSG